MKGSGVARVGGGEGGVKRQSTKGSETILYGGGYRFLHLSTTTHHNTTTEPSSALRTLVNDNVSTSSRPLYNDTQKKDINNRETLAGVKKVLGIMLNFSVNVNCSQK